MICCGVRFPGDVFENDPRGCRVCVSFPRFHWVSLLLLGDMRLVLQSLFLFFWEDFSCSPLRLPSFGACGGDIKSSSLLHFGLTQRGGLSSLRGLGCLFELSLGL